LRTVASLAVPTIGDWCGVELVDEDGASKQVAVGLGLGLWITSRLVEMHGGTIRVESTPSAGACCRSRRRAESPPAATRSDSA
jgi:K+-sensing histidine kinase KdpD